LAGPLSNLALGVVFVGLAGILNNIGSGATINKIVITFIFIGYINILLFVFNLIPIPPLDGSRIVGYFLRGNAKRVYSSIEPYGFVLVLMLVMLFGFLLSNTVGGLANILFRLFGLPYRF
jgi:Zn-dependent protease